MHTSATEAGRCVVIVVAAEKTAARSIVCTKAGIVRGAETCDGLLVRDHAAFRTKWSTAIAQVRHGPCVSGALLLLLTCVACVRVRSKASSGAAAEKTASAIVGIVVTVGAEAAAAAKAPERHGEWVATR